LKSVGIVSVFRVDTTRRCTSSSKNEEHGEENAEDDDRISPFPSILAALYGKFVCNGQATTKGLAAP
jgi:hypothetical protein